MKRRRLSRFGQSGCDKEALLLVKRTPEKAYVRVQWCHTLYQERYGCRCASLPDEILYGVNERTDCFIRKMYVGSGAGAG
ncbi:MAG: hypothetical protein ACLSCU_00650 [Eubacterium sp.]